MENRFSGVAALYRKDKLISLFTDGYRNMADELPNLADTRFPTASMGKGFVACGILSLIEKNRLSLDTRLCDVLPLPRAAWDKDVTVLHLLTHTSGVPDYFDESVMEDYEELWQDFPCYRVRRSRDLLPLFESKPMMYPLGERFQYNNSGFVLLDLIIEQLTGAPFDRYLQSEIFDRAGMVRTGYYEMDRLPGGCANAYIPTSVPGEYRTNIFAVDTKGTGAGGAFTTLDDMHAFWRALYSDVFFSSSLLENMVRMHSGEDDPGSRYGLGVWLDCRKSAPVPYLQGSDPGVSALSRFDPETDSVLTAFSNLGQPLEDVLLRVSKG